MNGQTKSKVTESLSKIYREPEGICQASYASRLKRRRERETGLEALFKGCIGEAKRQQQILFQFSRTRKREREQDKDTTKLSKSPNEADLCFSSSSSFLYDNDVHILL